MVKVAAVVMKRSVEGTREAGDDGNDGDDGDDGDDGVCGSTYGSANLVTRPSFSYKT